MPEASSRRERESRERAAKLVGVSGRAVQQAKAILRDTPDLAEKVVRGDGGLRDTDMPLLEEIPTMVERGRPSASIGKGGVTTFSDGERNTADYVTARLPGAGFQVGGTNLKAACRPRAPGPKEGEEKAMESIGNAAHARPAPKR